MTDPTSSVWKEVLADDKRTPVPDQAAFRIDLSCFLGQQSDRTRRVLGMLAEGYRQTEVADALGVTPPAICQRRKKAAREWAKLQCDADPESGKQDVQLRSPTAHAVTR